MADLIEYAKDHLTNASNAVGDEGCAILEGLLGAQRRISQAIELYYNAGIKNFQYWNFPRAPRFIA